MTMAMKQELQNALTTAMKARDEDTKRTLRLVMSVIKLMEVEKGGQIDDVQILGILQKEIKTRYDMIAEARRADRVDLLEVAEKEITILNRFLPKQMDPEELKELAKETIQELGATHIRDMGEVMKNLMPRIAGRASGKLASEIVRDILKD
jgi:uncharacterized protein